MPVQIYNLRNVPEDELEAMRERLQAAQIDFYETPAGNWGISLPAIWLSDENAERAEEAKALIIRYQQERAKSSREEYQRLRQLGEQRTLLDSIRERPGRFFLYLIFSAGLIYLSVMPFIWLIDKSQ